MKTFISDTVKETLDRAEKIYNKQIPMIPVLFDLKGKSAGVFTYRIGSIMDGKLRFNIPIAEANGKEAYKKTIIHEVAHYIVKVLYGGKIKPHGKEWKSVMYNFDTEASVTHSYTVPTSSRTMRYYDYKCGCGTSHSLSAIIHNKIKKGGHKRICRKCKTVLIKC